MSAEAVLAATPVLVAVALDDLQHHRIRNRHIALLAIITVAVVGALAFDGGADVVGHSVLGALFAGVPLAITWLAQPGRLGGGDVKLAAILGALVGVGNPRLGVAVVGLALLFSLVAAVGLRQQRIALGPGLVVAALLVAVANSLV